MTLITWLLVGGLAGWLASLIVGSHESIIMDVIIGILGAFVGGTLYTLLTTGTFDINSAITGLNIGSLIIATLGAVVLLFVIKAFRGNANL